MNISYIFLDQATIKGDFRNSILEILSSRPPLLNLMSSEPNQPSAEDYSTDEELPLWFSHSEQERHDTFDRFERRMVLLRTQLDTAPHIIGPPLLALSQRFEVLATEVVSSLCYFWLLIFSAYYIAQRGYGFNVRDVGLDHWLFEFLEAMWGLAVAIRVRLYGDAGIADGRPLYSYSVAGIRMMVLNAHKFANLVSNYLLPFYSR